MEPNLPDTNSYRSTTFSLELLFLYSPLTWEGDIFQKIYLNTTAFFKLKEGDKINVEHFLPYKNTSFY